MNTSCCFADASKDLNSQELAALDVSVQAIEQKLREIQQFITREKQAIAKARAVISACTVQQDQLQYISTHLPTRLPQATVVSSHTAQPIVSTSFLGNESSTEERDTDENNDAGNMEAQPATTAQAAGDKKKRARAPRRSVASAVSTR